MQAAVFLADLGFGPTADRPTSALAVGGVAEGDCGYPIAVSLIEGDAVVAVTAARACRMKIVGLGSGLEPADCDKASELVGGTGIEPVTSSVGRPAGGCLEPEVVQRGADLGFPGVTSPGAAEELPTLALSLALD